MKRLLEASVEAHLKNRVEKECGGWAIKLFPIVETGLPDRLVLFPRRKAVNTDRVLPASVHFVELKRPGINKERRRGQSRVRTKLEMMGFVYELLNTKDAVDAFITEQYQ